MTSQSHDEDEGRQYFLAQSIPITVSAGYFCNYHRENRTELVTNESLSFSHSVNIYYIFIRHYARTWGYRNEILGVQVHMCTHSTCPRRAPGLVRETYKKIIVVIVSTIIERCTRY